MDFVLSLSSVAKSFGHQPVLKEISFSITPGEKVALIGQNGTGKTTLLNIIYGLEMPDSGELTMPDHIRLGYMTQDSKLDESKTLIEFASVPEGRLGFLAKRIAYLEKLLEGAGQQSQQNMETASKEYAEALEEFAAGGGYARPSRVEGTLENLGFSKKHFNVRMSELSGGERTKARLARIVLEAEGVNLLLLDEPTNHLDIETTEWLEDYLAKYPGAVLMVSHDRYFLDKLVTKVIELEAAYSSVYSGNYSAYMEKKAREMEDHELRYNKQQKEIKRQEEMIEFMHRIYHYRTIHKTRQKMLDRMEKVDRPEDHARKFKVNFGKAEKSGKDSIDVMGVTKSFGQVSVIGKCNFRIEKGEKFGLIGPNGSGKTTLLRMIMGEEKPTSGEIKVSKGTDIGYYSQEQDNLIKDNTVYREILKEKPDASELWARSFLGGFLFRGSDIYKKIFVLSGGERARLAIAKLLVSKHNTLILDEPTNYLDALARESVEKALAEYEGTLIVVSHDRALLDSIATGIIEVKNGVVSQHSGNYSEYRRRKGRQDITDDGTISFEVTRKYTDWSKGKKYSAGDVIKMGQAEIDKHQWAIDNGILVRKKK